MKTITVLLIAALWMSLDARAQTAATWSFSGSSVAASNVGTGITASTVTMGADVTGGGQFSGSDFFGQDGWPATTTIDPNAYMQFSVGPNSGYYLVLNTVVMNLRHSTLGYGSRLGAYQLDTELESRRLFERAGLGFADDRLSDFHGHTAGRVPGAYEHGYFSALWL